MNTELQRQRVAQFQQQREQYLQARQRASQPTLAADRQLLSNRYRYLPALLVAPFALLAIAGALDLFSLLTGNGFWSSLSFALIPAGVIGGIVAVAVGVHDWCAAPAGSRVRGVGVWFAIGATLVATIFAQSWVARIGVDSDAGGLGVVLGFIGAAIALMTGWLLGEYLERLAALRPAHTTPPAVTEQTNELHHVGEIIEERRVAHAAHA
jgi:uncharacterized membrane protein